MDSTIKPGTSRWRTIDIVIAAIISIVGLRAWLLVQMPTAILAGTLTSWGVTQRIKPLIPARWSGHARELATQSTAFATGAADYLVKLPDSIELIARIRHHSRSYQNVIERDAAYRALSENQRQLMEMNEALQRLSEVDGLTGLNNRRYLNSYLESEWSRAIRDQESLSILMIDVDDFKSYNDAYGHLAGDEVLKMVAKTIRDRAKRPADIAARYGGEEFTMVLPATHAEGALRVAEQICAGVRCLAIPGRAAESVCITVSVGAAATVPSRGTFYSPLLEAADIALYDAKRAGKNRAVLREVR